MNSNIAKYNKTIVIADDDELNIELIRIILKNIDANIVTFGDGQEVIDYIITNNKASIVILDIQMPILDGFETSCKLHEIGYEGKIFAITALNTTTELEKYKECYFDEVIEKPIRRENFLKLINEVI
ncbi:MAG: hypothetical protein DRI86_00140 [Bacteroidetes bacterium]|nr:MAG: hypothetical protein DRI86_00140 [Bacteroidota bacterium]